MWGRLLDGQDDCLERVFLWTGWLWKRKLCVITTRNGNYVDSMTVWKRVCRKIVCVEMLCAERMIVWKG